MTIPLPEPASRRVLIIGGGPAGLSAGLWLHNLGLDPYLVDQETVFGGAMRLNFLSNDWVLGQPGMTGVQLAEKFSEHALAGKLSCQGACRPLAIRRDGSGWQVTLERNGELSTGGFAAVVVATGTRFRGWELFADVPGFAALQPHQIAFGPYAYEHMEALHGRHLVIVGGGDNAFENARFLLDSGARVTVLVRSSPKAQEQLMASVLKRSGFELMQPASIVGCSHGASGIGLEVKRGEAIVQLQADRLHVLAGYVPNTDFLDPLFEADTSSKPVCDPAGYLVTDNRGRTTTQGIYAAGDVCNRDLPCVLTALAGGARVAKAIEADLRGQGCSNQIIMESNP